MTPSVAATGLVDPTGSDDLMCDLAYTLNDVQVASLDQRVESDTQTLRRERLRQRRKSFEQPV